MRVWRRLQLLSARIRRSPWHDLGRGAKKRHTFGHRIADFQAIQLTLATMATEDEADRLLTRWAAAKLDNGQRAHLETGMAKFFASEVALRATLESMRIHGGLRLLRRARSRTVESRPAAGGDRRGNQRDSSNGVRRAAAVDLKTDVHHSPDRSSFWGGSAALRASLFGRSRHAPSWEV